MQEIMIRTTLIKGEGEGGKRKKKKGFFSKSLCKYRKVTSQYFKMQLSQWIIALFRSSIIPVFTLSIPCMLLRCSRKSNRPMQWKLVHNGKWGYLVHIQVGFSFSETVDVLILSNTSYCITIVHATLYTCVCIYIVSV